MKHFILIVLISLSLNSFSQEKTVYFFEDSNTPINNFQLNFFIKDSLSIYKSNGNNSFGFSENFIKQLDSIIISFDSFYTKKINLNELKNKDSIFIKKEISLTEITINKTIIREELGVVSKNKHISKVNNFSRSESLIEIDVSNYKGAYVESISLYIFEKFRDLFNGTKRTNKNLDIQFYLFQSNINPDKEVVNLLKNKLIVNTEKGKKGWINIDLRDLNIKILDYNYLYIGYHTFGKPIAVGVVKKKKMDLNVILYRRLLYGVDKSWFSEVDRKAYIPDEVTVPAIKIGLRH